MWFPQNPKVLVVDDHYEEVEPLLTLFSKQGIPYIYYDGKMDSVPEKPFSSIRYVILDIDLYGRTSGLNEKNKASALAGYLGQLITIKESPYEILFWTRHEDVIEYIISYLNEEDGSPVVYKSLEKPSKDELTPEYVKSKIFSDLNDDAFEFLLKWEDSVSQDASRFTNNISNIIKQEVKKTSEKWNASMKNILSKLACTYLGVSKISSEDKDNALEYASHVFNQSFSEGLSLVDKSVSLNIPLQTSVSLQTIAELNSILFIDKIGDSKIENGKIFFADEKDTIFSLLNDKILSKQGKKDCKCTFISVILTPSCDLSHKKYLFTGNPLQEYHRILSGLKIEVGDNEDYESYFNYSASAYSKKNKVDNLQIDDKTKKEIKSCISCNKPEFLYETNPFVDENGKVCVFVFHFGTVQTKAIEPGQIKFSYLLKNSLLSDLQTKLANHVNRLGNSMLEYK